MVKMGKSDKTQGVAKEVVKSWSKGAECKFWGHISDFCGKVVRNFPFGRWKAYYYILKTGFLLSEQKIENNISIEICPRNLQSIP